MTTVSVDASEQMVPIAGGSIYVKRWTPDAAGAPGRVPILLLHDSLGCVELWRQFPSALARQLRRPVIAYDRWGFGRSSKRLDLPSARFVNEEADVYFPQLKAHLGIHEFLLLGHSVGGAMAVLIAARHPHECRAVVTEAAQAFVEQKTLASIHEGRLRFAIPEELAKLERYHGDKASWVVRAWTETWLSAEFADWNLRSELPKVTCPLLAIHGDRDEYGSSAFPDALSSMTSGHAEKMIVSHCGHVPHREQEAIVLQRLEKFIGDAAP